MICVVEAKNDQRLYGKGVEKIKIVLGVWGCVVHWYMGGGKLGSWEFSSMKIGLCGADIHSCTLGF
jgi:hypothetical protein